MYSEIAMQIALWLIIIFSLIGMASFIIEAFKNNK